VYAPSLGGRIVSDVQYVYGVNLLSDKIKSAQDLFFLYRYVLEFSTADWMKIKNRYPSFRYVLTSTYLSGLNEKYFKKIYYDSSFNIYEIEWETINSDYNNESSAHKKMVNPIKRISMNHPGGTGVMQTSHLIFQLRGILRNSMSSENHWL